MILVVSKPHALCKNYIHKANKARGQRGFSVKHLPNKFPILTTLSR